MSEKGSPAQVVMIGMEAESSRRAREALPHASFRVIQAEQIEALVDEPISPIPRLILCGPETGTIPPEELAQLLRSQCPSATLYFVSMERTVHDRKLLHKNGFNDCLVLVVDQAVFTQKVLEALGGPDAPAVYRAVRLIDIQAESHLDFDVWLYLPANRKHVIFSPAGETMGTERLDKLHQHRVSSIYVRQNQMAQFYEYSARQLQQLGKDDRLSETEKQHKFEGSVRSLLTEALGQSEKDGNIESGRAIMADCQRIVSQYILKSTSDPFLKRMMTTLEAKDQDAYSHTGNVATLAALFSMGLGIGKPEELATAGLLHDLGMANVPWDIQEKPENKRTEVEQALYRKHVEYTLDLIKQQKLILSDAILKMIAQHHERYSGGGYPKGLAGNRLMPEAQLLAFADRFDFLTRIQPGAPRLDVFAAIRRIRQEEASDPGQCRFSPEILHRLSSLITA